MPDHQHEPISPYPPNTTADAGYRLRLAVVRLWHAVLAVLRGGCR